MSDMVWDGITQSKTLTPEASTLRHQLADAAKASDWKTVLALLDEHEQLINITRPSGTARYTALHQAAYNGVAQDIVQALLQRGAWRTLRTSKGERALDIAKRLGHHHLQDLLTPIFKQHVSLEALQQIQQHFHAVIAGRANDLIQEEALWLPELEPLLEMDEPRLWFTIPGMYGGFHFWLDKLLDNPVLISESWCRVVGGSGQRHLISPFGSVLLAQGFV